MTVPHHVRQCYSLRLVLPNHSLAESPPAAARPHPPRPPVRPPIHHQLDPTLYPAQAPPFLLLPLLSVLRVKGVLAGPPGPGRHARARARPRVPSWRPSGDILCRGCCGGSEAKTGSGAKTVRRKAKSEDHELKSGRAVGQEDNHAPGGASGPRLAFSPRGGTTDNLYQSQLRQRKLTLQLAPAPTLRFRLALCEPCARSTLLPFVGG